MEKTAYWLNDPEQTFNAYSRYLKHIYGVPVYRVSVDAGFSCPHRGADRSAPGCLFCDNSGARAPYLGNQPDLARQVSGAMGFLKKRYRAEEFILYFQAFSGTFAPVTELKKIYDYTLGLAPFRELVVSTRPDCIDPEITALLADYNRNGLTTWVELGLQSASGRTLDLINRGHTVADFLTAYRLLKQAGLKVAVHVIFGCPGEGMEEILATIRFLAGLEPDGIKIHNLHIVRGTVMEEDFLKGEMTVPTGRQHLEYVIRALELLPPETIIMRLTCDTLAGLLVSPGRFPDKAAFYNLVTQTMLTRETRQGRCFRV